MSKIKQKSLQDYLDEDKSLTTPRTYEEMTTFTYGVDDSGIEKAYDAFRKVEEELNSTT